jgi:hypothetical protein
MHRPSRLAAPLLCVLLGACSGAPPSGAGPAGAGPEHELSAEEQAMARYRAWLRQHGRSEDGAKVATMRDAGEWSFLHVDPTPGTHLYPAAVQGQLLVSAGEPPGWLKFIQDQDADALHHQIAWLNGMWSALAPDTTFADNIEEQHPEVKGKLTAPRKQSTGGGVVFEAWYAAPPSFEPFRVTLRATEGSIDLKTATPEDL